MHKEDFVDLLFVAHTLYNSYYPKDHAIEETEPFGDPYIVDAVYAIWEKLDPDNTNSHYILNMFKMNGEIQPDHFKLIPYKIPKEVVEMDEFKYLVNRRNELGGSCGEEELAPAV